MTSALCGLPGMPAATSSAKEQGSSLPQPPPLPELQGTCYEMLVGEAGPIYASPQGNPQGPAPVFLALVDVSRGADADFIELVRSGLFAALEALPPYTLFGLVTFGDKVCLHDLKAKVPCARQVPIPPAPQKGTAAGTHSHRLAVPLAEAMPLHALLAPVGAFKESITAALEAIQPQPPALQPPPQPPLQQQVSPAGRADLDHAALGTAHWSSIQGAGAPGATTTLNQQEQQQQQQQGDRRGFGATLFGVLEYLQAIKSPPFTLPQHLSASSSANSQYPAATARPAQGLPQEAALPDAQSPVRLAVFLSGPPDYGTASLRSSTAEASGSSSSGGSNSSTSGVGKGSSSGSAGGVVQQSAGAQNSAQAVNAASESGEAQGAALDSQQQQQQQQDSQAQAAPEPCNPRDAWMSQVDPQAASFYKQAAVAAAALGCCCDVYAVSSCAVGLDYLAPLPNSTGGAIFLYTSVDDSALPQDIYRRLSGQHAFGGLLRVRTSQGFHAARYYGRLFSDPQIEDLYHVINAGDSDTFAVEFLYGSSKAKPNNQDVICTPPTIQVAFQYSVAVPVPSSTGSEAASANGAAQSTANGAAQSTAEPAADTVKATATVGCMLQRRVRVSTYRAGVTGSSLEAMRSCNSRAVLAVMLHKLMRVSVLQGRPRARLLLLDWLVELETMYHAALHAPPTPLKTQQQRAQHLLRSPVDVSFSGAAALHPMPRLVYALLRSPVLAPPVEGQHGDLVAFLEHCWGSLTPSELACAVYPHLTAYADPDTVVCSNLPLSKSMLHPPPSSGVPQIPPIFLLDAYIVILVLYTSSCPSHIPYPPPQQSALRRSIGAIRQERKIAPMVRVVREGSEDAQLFFHLLLDEPAEEPASAAGQGEGAALQNGGNNGGSSGSSREQHASTMGSSADARGSGLQHFLEHVTFGGGKVAAVATLVGRLQRYQHMQNLDMGLHKELDPGTSSALPSVW
eukprot:CAMPEP_0202381876 /NCGR_PEP_ID=MMETSP1127-20130417/39382_1 /ASSEMBLY_ACC=CAM_ASM_000462 /TAXON_ID=3047 /ORGANISM="Dunaliella tertiolecta, Strain CCMP1320" /LENGTH=964 /DNA_ID=CAMNT_0048980955 /DNA_START=356 /DNA_END=3245 /DNA_ORIENTATION=-